jgi:hypothetical protein
MPNVRKFLEHSVWYTNARCFLPAATDMNHLNALAGTTSGQTGIIGISRQITRWDSAGMPVLSPITLEWPRDIMGQPVDTLFHAWKRAFPGSKTAFISGKGWVAEGYLAPEASVDYIITATYLPDYIPKPFTPIYADPPSDLDAECDPETSSGRLLLCNFMEMTPSIFPADQWIIDAALMLFEREVPDMAYILLAQADDCGHALGAGWNLDEFVPSMLPYRPDVSCENLAEYQLVATRNRIIYREPILDTMREVDHQFSRLIAGLQAQGVLHNATIMLLSDHSMSTYFRIPPTDIQTRLEMDILGILNRSGLNGNNDMAIYSGMSFAALYWREGKERAEMAKDVLLSRTAVNPETGIVECPWWVIDRSGMKHGVEDICLPGELYNEYFVEVDEEGSLVWPDLFVFAKDGWKIPAYSGWVNLGIENPTDSRKRMYDNVFIGGHGSLSTLSMLMAISGPNIQARRISDRVYISDLALTAASLFGLTLNSATVGKDLSRHLGVQPGAMI